MIRNITSKSLQLHRKQAYYTIIKFLVAIAGLLPAHYGFCQPEQIWATYYGESNLFLGPTMNTETSSVEYSSDGFIYIAGFVAENTVNLATPGSFLSTFPAPSNLPVSAYLAKFDISGNRIWGTYVSNISATLMMTPRIALDNEENILFAAIATHYAENNIGTQGTHNPSIPPSGDQPAPGEGPYSFLIKFDSSGQRLWGTYLEDSITPGNSLVPLAVTTDPLNNIIVGGTCRSCSTVFPPGTHKSIPDTTTAGFLIKFDPDGKRQWGTYYGGAGMTCVTYLDCDSLGNIYSAGATKSNSEIATNGTSYPTAPVITDTMESFIAKFNSSGQRIWGTYLNGINWLGGLKYGRDGFLYALGLTHRDTGIATPGVHQESFEGVQDIALTKWTSDGHKVWGTYYGGNLLEFLGGMLWGEGFVLHRQALDLDDSGNILIVGGTHSKDGIRFGCTYDVQTTDPNFKGFMAKFYDDGKLMWGSYFDTDLKSVAAGPGQDFYVVTQTNKDSLASPGAFQPGKTPGMIGGYLAKMRGDYICPTIYETIEADSNHLSIGNGYQNYQWFLNGQPIPGGTAAIHATDSGSYQVFFEDSCACRYQSDVYYFVPEDSDETFIRSFDKLGNSFEIFPNPAGNKIRLALQSHQTTTTSLVVDVRDISGKVILNADLFLNPAGMTEALSISELPPGLYFLTTSVNGYRHTKKFVKR